MTSTLNAPKGPIETESLQLEANHKIKQVDQQSITKKSFLQQHKRIFYSLLILFVISVIVIPIVVIEVQKNEESKPKIYVKNIESQNVQAQIQVGNTQDGQNYVLIDFSELSTKTRALEISATTTENGVKEVCQNIILDDDSTNEAKVFSKCGKESEWKIINQESTNSTIEIRIEEADQKEISDHSFLSTQEVQAQVHELLENRKLFSVEKFQEVTKCGGVSESKRYYQESRICYPRISCRRFKCSKSQDCKVITVFQYTDRTCIKYCYNSLCNDPQACVNKNDCSCVYLTCPYGYENTSVNGYCKCNNK